MKKIIALLGLISVVGLASAQAPFSLVDGNAVVNGDAAGGLLTDWFTDGVDDLFNQDYYYRVGLNPEAPIWTASAPALTILGPNMANVAYTTNQFRMDITYTLIGGAPGSGTSDIGEIVRVQNLTSGVLNFHLFEYDDFDLNGSAGGDNAALVNSSTIMQWENNTTAMVGSVPPFDRWEIDSWPNILVKLNDGVADNLSNTGSPSGPADLAFAMQWDRNIAAHGTFLMSKNKRIEVVPEPATFAALGLGVLALARRRRKA
jgi:hypothetical protein